jgi:hypothetical protein
LIALFLSVVWAAEPAHYHPDDVAKGSKRFAEAAEAMGPAFEAKSSKISALATAMDELELGVALLGAAAPGDLRAWADATRRKVVGESLRVQRHVDLLQEDYGRVFGAALDRALPVVGKGYDLKVCGATGMAAMVSSRKSCAGLDLNPRLAAALDADTVLVKELASIASVEWPDFTPPQGAQPVVALTGTTRWIAGGVVARKLMGARIEAGEDSLEAELERVMPDEATEASVKEAQAIKAKWVAQLGADGELLRGAITAALGRAAKKGAPAEVGWCANPVSLGGCPGEDVTQVVLDLLAADKRFAKDIRGLVAE